MTTLRILIALSCITAGAIVAILGFAEAWGNETFRAIVAFCIPAAQVGFGVVAIVCGLVVLAHEERLTDWVKGRGS